MKFITTTLIVFNLFTQIFCQKSILRNEQLWVQYYNQVKLSEKITFLSDFSIRFKSGISNYYQLTSRVGIGYPICKKTQGITGFAIFTSFNKNSVSLFELRPYQELNTTHGLGKMKIQNRFRIEFRNFNFKSSGTKLTTSNFRFRYRLFLTYPLINLSKKKIDSKLLLNIGDELLINAGENIIYNTLDNNRLLLGLGFQLNNKITCSLTYCYQFGERSKNLNEQSDIFWIGIIHKIGYKN